MANHYAQEKPDFVHETNLRTVLDESALGIGAAHELMNDIEDRVFGSAPRTVASAQGQKEGVVYEGLHPSARGIAAGAESLVSRLRELLTRL